MAAFAPDYRIAIGGRPLPAAAVGSVMRISHTDGLVGADRVEVTLANPNLRWLDDPLFAVDAPLTLALGYAGRPLTDVFAGEITGVTPTFPSGGMPTLTVVAHDRLNRLNVGAVMRSFAVSIPGVGQYPLPDPVVAGVLAGINTLVPAIDAAGAAVSFLALTMAYAIDATAAQNAVRVQQRESDFEFLTRMGRENGWEMGIDHAAEPRGWVLRFQSLFADFAPDAVLEWGRSLIEFQPRLSRIGQVAGVHSRHLVAAVKTELLVSLAWDFDRAAFDFRVVPVLPGMSEATTAGKFSGYLATKARGIIDLPRMILGELLPRLNERQTATGTALGDPRLQAGKILQVEGVGSQFGGLYRITSATNTLDGSGYRTSFECRKEVWFGSVPTPRGVGGLARVQGTGVR